MPLPNDPDWTIDALEAYDAAISAVAIDEFGLDGYPCRVEIVTTAQLLQARAYDGLPTAYCHWRAGKSFLLAETALRHSSAGLRSGLAVNANPCIVYLPENNAAALQALLIAHACYGQNAFFKGNQLFRRWSDAAGIVEFAFYARRYIAECEERYGIQSVESLLDACHALMSCSVDSHPKAAPETPRRAEMRRRSRLAFAQEHYDDIWRTLPVGERASQAQPDDAREPEDNLLAYIERRAERLADWERQVVRIVRTFAQHLYPHSETAVMCEGWAAFWRHAILERLHAQGRISDGFALEALHAHTNSLLQPVYDDPGYTGIEPAALGYAIWRDLRRICERPTDEDRAWFPEFAGTDWRRVFDFAMRGFRDESFIAQFLSPRVMREFRLFAVAEEGRHGVPRIVCVHDEGGYRRLRQLLAAQCGRDWRKPRIEVVRYERAGDRSLNLRYHMLRRRALADDARRAVQAIAQLWRFPVKLHILDEDGTTSTIHAVT
jgi:stage V sporulation protein R